MPNKNIFCNTPWYELHIYWDGSLGICCTEDHKLYSPTDNQYNIATMSINEWFNSDPVQNFRTSILGNSKLSECRRCYMEEDHSGNSRRLKSNQKSVIFTRTAFEESFRQSPGYRHFSSSITDTHPIDIHVDLGNFCNLACKMCKPEASSTIASQQVKWGIKSSQQYLGTDWTKNLTVWNSFKQQLLSIPNLSNIHFMGGETLLTNRFDDLVDTMIEHNRFDICFSFVTNGTVFRSELLDKLKQFRRVGIEISIETIDEHNTYQRQGTNTELVLENIKKYQQWCNGSNITITLRPVPSLLTIGYYTELLQYALDNQFVVKSNLCYEPRFLSVEILPEEIKTKYQIKYKEFLAQFTDVHAASDYNASDPNNFKLIIKEQAEMCLYALSTPTPLDSMEQLEAMVRHCERWDRVYGYDARILYPEWQDIFDQFNYDISS